VTPVVLVVLLAAAGVEPAARTEPQKVVFVCEHGNVKSLIAQEWFNRRAQERGLAVRAVSRGRRPEASVPSSIADALARDGFEVRAFVPQAPAAAEMRGAARVIGIGLDQKALETTVDVETWEGIPPASQDYAASRDALRARIETLLSALASRP
jgi:arsenate reductase (thioredoxin)